MVPRPWAVRQELEAWGYQQPALPLRVETPGRTQDEGPRRWQGHSVLRQGEGEDSDGRVAQEGLRCVVVHASHLAQQQAQSYAAAHAQEAQAVVEHRRHVHARWVAGEADAAAASAAYEHRGPGRRGRRPQSWRYPTLHSRVVADPRPRRRARRGRPAKTAPSPREAG